MDEEALKKNEHLVVSCTLEDLNNKLRSYAMLDLGATGFSFIDEELVSRHSLPLYKLKEPRGLEVFDGRLSESGNITHVTKLKMTIDKHVEELPMFVTKLGHYPIILEKPWFSRHNSDIKYSTDEVTFNSDYCLEHCCPVPAYTKGISAPLPEKQYVLISGAAFTRTSARKRQHHVVATGAFTLHELERALRLYSATDPTSRTDKIPSNSDNEAYLRTLIPDDLQDFLWLFRKEPTDKLPPHRSYDHRIPLKDGFTPPFGPLYSMSRNELQAAWEWLKTNLGKGFVRASSSPGGAPVLFTKKKDGTLRFCIDYRGLNEGTIKNRYPLPLINETLTQLSKARYYIKLDIRDTFNLIRVADENVWKTAFRTRWELYETLVMPFGLTNASISF